jgi:alpha,alpha-trehalose phosphorylase
MSWRKEMLGFRPLLPKSWSSVVFRMLWRGRLIEVTIGQSKAKYTLLQGEPLEIKHFGAPVMLSGLAELDCPPVLDRVA